MPLKPKAVPFSPSGETHRIVSCNEGKHAYVFTLDGKTHHVAYPSAEFDGLTDDPKFDRDKERLGWTH